MNLRELAAALLDEATTEEVDRARQGVALLDEVALSARLVFDGEAHTVAWDPGRTARRLDRDDGGAPTALRIPPGLESAGLACTCGASRCHHRLAFLLLIAEQADLAEPRERAGESGQDEDEQPPAEGNAPAPELEEPPLADALSELIVTVCQDGVREASKRRDETLERVVERLAHYDLPDLRRAVATLRRMTTAERPDPWVSLAALARVARHLPELRAGEPEDRRLSSSIALNGGATRREEVRLLEVARRTKRTPFGDRREVSFFLDLDERLLFQELGTSSPGSTALYLSDGPFPKRIMGNLVAVEPGPSPRHVRLLQYASTGFASQDDLEILLRSASTSVGDLYEAHRASIEAGLAPDDHLVLYAPDRVLPSRSGIVLLDDDGTTLPLTRGMEPALCQTLDMLARRSTILVVVGQLFPSGGMLCLLPLAALLENDGRRSLWRIT